MMFFRRHATRFPFTLGNAPHHLVLGHSLYIVLCYFAVLNASIRPAHNVSRCTAPWTSRFALGKSTVIQPLLLP